MFFLMDCYTEFKKSFCECCDTKSSCKLGWPCTLPLFIDFEAVVENKSSPQHDWPHCDAVYTSDNETVYLIEFKNINWFFDKKTNQLKDLAYVKEYLSYKFLYSERLLKDDGFTKQRFKHICAYDFNDAPILNESIEELKRLLRNNFFTLLEQANIYSEECKTAYYNIVF